ncbi:lipid-A-disaccharide synthase [Oceaniglobus ichthyenteri]|uniref:lipid-A-disaccharide synthase n=1 Tax=Oceaniglobus ichthyenteri TaxID=2136177 RepID=UPI000D378C08|nr:lipid-A-disaccharide synthase [Oceaniglobus ichthyenteri]
MKVFLVAGEASGDRLGAALMAGLKSCAPKPVEWAGVGGPLMAEQGLHSLFAMQELSVMGIAEVLPKYRHLRRRMIETADAVLTAQPDVLITIDSPDFGLRVAARVRAQNRTIRTVHYVAPSVWAWRPGRAAKMARHVDQVLALLPFEPPYMEAAGMRCDFVGHPVVAEPQADAAEIAAFRQTHNLGDAPVLLVLPGSRGSEVARLLPIFAQVVAKLHAARPDLRVVVPAAPGVHDSVRDGVRDWAGRPVVLDMRGQSGDAAQHQKAAAFGAANVALAASGTVSLELAAAGTPMVVAYDMSWLSWQIMSRAALIDTVTLVNLVSETRIIPEFLGPACQPGPIADALLSVLNAHEEQAQALSLTMMRLGKGGIAPGRRAAMAVLEGLNGTGS